MIINDEKKEKEVVFDPDAFLEASVLLLSILEANGEETRLAESTTLGFARIYGVDEIEVYATATYVSISFEHEGRYYSGNSRINVGKDYRKISRANRLVNQLSKEKKNLTIVKRQFKRIKKDQVYYPPQLRYLGMFLANGSLAYILDGTLADFIPAGIAGMLGVAANDLVDRKLDVGFLSDFVGGFVVAMVVYLLSLIGLEGNIYWSIFGGIMGLAPGSVLFSGFRELMTRHSSAGLTIVMQGVVSALALGLGIYVAMGMVGINLLPYR